MTDEIKEDSYWHVIGGYNRALAFLETSDAPADIRYFERRKKMFAYLRRLLSEDEKRSRHDTQ